MTALAQLDCEWELQTRQDVVTYSYSAMLAIVVPMQKQKQYEIAQVQATFTVQLWAGEHKSPAVKGTEPYGRGRVQ